MDGVLEVTVVGAWIWLTVASLVRVMSERRRWNRQHKADVAVVAGVSSVHPPADLIE
jgi:hypothetical protein